MHGWETRMLLRHCLERRVRRPSCRGGSASAGLRSTPGSRTGSWTGIWRPGETRYSPRPRRSHKLDAYKDHRQTAGGVSAADGAAAVRRGARGRVRGCLQPRARLRHEVCPRDHLALSSTLALNEESVVPSTWVFVHWLRASWCPDPARGCRRSARLAVGTKPAPLNRRRPRRP